MGSAAFLLLKPMKPMATKRSLVEVGGGGGEGGWLGRGKSAAF